MQGYDWSSCWRWKNREADAQASSWSHGGGKHQHTAHVSTVRRDIAPPRQKDVLIAARLTDHLRGQDADSAAKDD
ncbi:unnamed protein product [Arabidopsis halleri]